MLSLYEILKASKTGIAPDMWTALAGMNWGGADSGHEVKELTGIPPLSFTADGTPLLDYLISGNTVQNGIPTPTNPVDVNGVGVMTENLFDAKRFVDTAVRTNATASLSGNTIILTPIEQDAYVNRVYSRTQSVSPNERNCCISVSPETEYTIFMERARKSYVSFIRSDYSCAYGYLQIPDTWPQEPFTFTTPSDCTYIVIRLGGWVASTSTQIEFPNIMLVEGSEVPSAYIPYSYKIPISSGDVTTNIYLGSTQTTRQIGKYIFDGSSIFTTQRSVYRNNTAFFATTAMAGTGVINRPSMNNYFVVPSSGINPQTLDYACSGFHPSDQFSSYYYLRVPYDVIGMTDSNTNNEFITALNTWLSSLYNSGNPMIAYYALATPETATVNEPLMKIGDYADTVSMEQAGVSIPTLNGQTVVDVETTLKPSQMYIKYQE